MNELQTTEQNVTVITPLKDLVTALVDCKARLKALDDEYEKASEPLKEVKKTIEAEIMQTFKDRGEYSSRIDNATVSMSVRKTAQIIDEVALVRVLKQQSLDTYVQERVTELFKDSVLKEQTTSETPLDGVFIKETEYISVRTNDKKDARKITGEFVKIKQ